MKFVDGSGGEEELVRQVHTLFVRSDQQVCSLRTSSVGRSGRSAAGSAGKRKRRARRGETLAWTWTCGLSEWSLLEPRCVCEVWRAITQETEQCALRLDNVEVSVNGHVVIGARIVQCHHAIMAISEFSTFGPNFILVQISTCNLFPDPTCCQAECFDRHFFLYPFRAHFCTVETCHSRCGIYTTHPLVGLLRAPCCCIPRTANTQIQELQVPNIVTF